MDVGRLGFGRETWRQRRGTWLGLAELDVQPRRMRPDMRLLLHEAEARQEEAVERRRRLGRAREDRQVIERIGDAPSDRARSMRYNPRQIFAAALSFAP